MSANNPGKFQGVGKDFPGRHDIYLNHQVINFIKDGLDADKKNKLVLPRDVRTIAEMMREERPMSVMEYDKMIRCSKTL